MWTREDHQLEKVFPSYQKGKEAKSMKYYFALGTGENPDSQVVVNDVFEVLNDIVILIFGLFEVVKIFCKEIVKRVHVDSIFLESSCFALCRKRGVCFPFLVYYYRKCGQQILINLGK